MIKPVTLTVTIAFALSSSLGCATAVVWCDASQTRITSPRVRRIDPAANGQPARAIINYTVADDGQFGRFDRILPLGPDGLPPEPFRYHGKLLTLGDIAQDLPTPQKLAILKSKLAPIDRPAPAIPASSTRHALPATRPAQVLRNWSPPFHPACEDQIGVLVLSPDPLRVWPQAHRCGGDPDLANVRVKPGDVVVFVPLSEPRPAGDLACSRLGATILTPPAVAADAAIVGITVPLFVFMLFTGNLPRC